MVLQHPNTVNILLVDDREDNLYALNAVLRSPEYNLVNAMSGAQALEHLRERDFAVILLDVQMPGMDGLETARRIRSQERSQNTPIILVTGIFPDEEHIRLGYEVGAVDFVSKPFDPRVMKCKVAVFVDLFRKTEKIRAQEALLHEASESRFRTLFEQSPLAIQLYSLRGDCAAVNRAWEKLWGPLAPLPMGGAIRKALSGESSESPPAQFHGKWLESFVYPVRNEQGEIREVAVILKDVSDQKGVEEELRRSRDQLRIIFERVVDGIIMHDLEDRAVYANDAGAKLLGFASADAILGKSAFSKLSLFDIYDLDGNPVTLDRIPTRLALLGRHKAPETVVRMRERSTGHERWLIISSRPVLDDAGKPYLAVSIYRDITEARRTEENERFLADATAILASSLDYRRTMAQVAELAVGRLADWCKVSIADEHGVLHTAHVTHSDPNLLALSQESSRQFLASADGKVGSPRVFRTGKSEMNSDIKDEDIREAASSEAHYAMFRRLGLRSVIFVPLRARDKIYGVLVLGCAEGRRRYDTVDLALAEELGRRAGMAIENAMLYQDAESQRERLQKAVQARDEFISIASHELKTPVTSLILHAEMAALQLERTDPVDDLRERIQKFVTISGSQIDRLSRLIDEMLDVSRIGNGKLSMEMETVDLSRVVKGVVEDFSEQLRETGSLATFEGDGPTFVRCDRYRIEQVVTNLLTNAMKYGEGRPIHVSVRSDGVHATLAVRDEGIGISPEHHARIFERFERAVSATSVGGLGLGLYIVKKIVEAHGGDVTVDSCLGRGATFKVALPAVAQHVLGAPAVRVGTSV